MTVQHSLAVLSRQPVELPFPANGDSIRLLFAL